MMTAWFAVYTCLSGCPSNQKITGHDPKYSQSECEAGARLVAQGMFIQNGAKYAYHCEQPDFDPPKDAK